MNKKLRIAFACLLAAGLIGCQPSPEGSPDAGQETAGKAAQAEPTTDASEVTYEPAYPADVSSEGLEPEDVPQQPTSHSHGEEEDHLHEGEGEGDGDHAEDEHGH